MLTCFPEGLQHQTTLSRLHITPTILLAVTTETPLTSIRLVWYHLIASLWFNRHPIMTWLGVEPNFWSSQSENWKRFSKRSTLAQCKISCRVPYESRTFFSPLLLQDCQAKIDVQLPIVWSCYRNCLHIVAQVTKNVPKSVNFWLNVVFQRPRVCIFIAFFEMSLKVFHVVDKLQTQPNCHKNYFSFENWR